MERVGDRFLVSFILLMALTALILTNETTYQIKLTAHMIQTTKKTTLCRIFLIFFGIIEKNPIMAYPPLSFFEKKNFNVCIEEYTDFAVLSPHLVISISAIV